MASVATSNDDQAGDNRRSSMAVRVLDVVNLNYDFVKSAHGGFREGEVFAVAKPDAPTLIESGDTVDTTNAIPVDSVAFTQVIEHLCLHSEPRFVPTSQVIQSAVSVLKAEARFNGNNGIQEVPVYSCTAQVFDPGLGEYMDHAGYAVHIDARDGEGSYTLFDGDWHYGPDASYFYRSDKFEPLKQPYEGDGATYHEYHDLKGLDIFSGLFPQVPDKDWPLIFGFIVTPWLYERCDGFPIMQVDAPGGSGKTTFIDTVQQFLSPENTPGASLPESAWDIAITAAHHRIFRYDNLSTLRKDQSDLLCLVSTGGSIFKRRLYSNLDTVSVSYNAPIMLTTTDLGTERQDLLDRSFIIQFDWGSNKKDGLIEERIDKATPHIMGSLLTLAAKVWQVLQEGTPENVTLGRLTTYSRVLHAIDLITSQSDETKTTHGLSTYLARRAGSFIESASDDPVFMAFVDLEGKGCFNPFDGKARDLYRQGTRFYQAVQNAYFNDGCGWEPPKSAISCGRRLSNLIPALNARGWNVQRRYSTNRGDHGTTMWHIQEPKTTQPAPAGDADDPAF